MDILVASWIATLIGGIPAWWLAGCAYHAMIDPEDTTVADYEKAKENHRLDMIIYQYDKERYDQGIGILPNPPPKPIPPPCSRVK